MIRKTLAFLLLVAVGLFVLRLSTGEEGFTGDGMDEQAAPAQTASDAGGIQIGGSEEGSDLPQGLSVKIGGKMSIPRTRTVTLGNRTRELQVYLLKCEDSVPIGDDRLQMLELTVDFFEVGGPPDDPVAVHVAKLEADEAFAQLGVDKDGRTSIDEDKEMRVVGARITTTEQARIPFLTLELDEALALATEEGIRVKTPDSTQPFRLGVTGTEPWEITGQGLEAWLPRQGGPDDQVTVDVLNRPRLFQTTVDGVTRLSARGKLSYRENPLDGRTIIVMEDRVEISIPGGSIGGEPIEASGQSLRAQLTRNRTSLSASDAEGDRATRWQRIWLQGDPVTLTATGAELLCDDLEIVPGPGGQPYLFSATGSPASMTHLDEDGIRTTTEASRRIHVLRPGNHQAPVLAAFGFPGWALGPLNRHELIIIEGRATVVRGDELLRASEGLWLLRSLAADHALPLGESDSAAPLAMHGRGEVEVVQPGEDGDLSLKGNMGFTLVQSGDVRRIRLGPQQLDSNHRYSVRRGELDLTGVGSCAMTQSDERVTVELQAPGPQINVTFGTEQGSLRDAVSLDATIAANVLESFVATGPVCRILWGAEDKLEARAQRIEGLDPDSFRLSGTVTSPATADYRPAATPDDASTVRARNVYVAGAEIRIHRISGDDLLIDTEAPQGSVARVRLQAVRGAETPTEIDLHARRIRFLPFGVRPAALYLDALPPGARELFAFGLRSPYLLAEEQVSVIQEEQPGIQNQRATGDLMLLGLGARAGYLTGNPALLERTDAQGQRVVGTASRVEMRSEDDGELLGLVATAERLPELELTDPTGSLSETGGEPSRLRVVCNGDIRVYPEAVRFLGAVEMRSVNLDGSEDPEGLKMLADAIAMTRDEETGEILEVQAEGNVRLDWSKVQAQGHRLTLDPRNTLITASHPERKAVVELPSGPSITAAMVRANYRTYRVTSWHSRVDGGGTGR